MTPGNADIESVRAQVAGQRLLLAARRVSMIAGAPRTCGPGSCRSCAVREATREVETGLADLLRAIDGLELAFSECGAGDRQACRDSLDNGERRSAVVSVLFADIVDSSGLFEAQGDRSAHRIVQRVFGRAASVTRARGGWVVKTIGDEIMCVFPSAAQAVGAARRMHRTLRGPGSPVVHLRAGIHTGRVIVDQGDVYGHTVIRAARIVRLAKPGGTAISGDALDELPAGPLQAEIRRRVALNGIYLDADPRG